MSHYTVTVVLPEEPKNEGHVQEMLGTLLAPFDENDQVEPYRSYTDPVNENWREMPEQELGWPYSSIRRQAPELDLRDLNAVAAWLNAKWGDEEAYGVDETGLYQMSTYNPQSKWDWWAVGGRWMGFYKLKEGAEGITGHPGAFGNAAPEGHVDVARKGDIDTTEKKVQTYSVLAEGVWKEPGKMGWFGWSSDTPDTRDSFDEWFQRFWDGLSDDAWLAVIDAHI